MYDSMLKTSKIFITLMVMLFSVNLLIIIDNVEGRVELSIVDYSYDLIKQVKKGRIMMSKYNITVKLHNSGDDDSGRIMVLLYDEEMVDPQTRTPLPLNKTVNIGPGETKTIVFEWSTGLYRNQNITIKYYLDNPKILRNQYNSGSLTFLIEVTSGQSNPGIPNLSLAMILISIVISILILRKRR
ncbi:MAG: hypothetical protein QXS02_01970 [Candidatus Thermoplasmatota archaeon]